MADQKLIWEGIAYLKGRRSTNEKRHTFHLGAPETLVRGSEDKNHELIAIEDGREAES